MKHILYILISLLSLFTIQAQDQREDDLGDVSDKFQSTFFEALKQKGIENYDKAINLLIDCKALEPENASVYFELGKNYFELDKFQLAEEALLKADQIKPNNKWVLEELYHVYSYQKKNTHTITILQKLNKISNSYANDLINSYYKDGQYDKAIALIDQLDNNEGVDKKREQLRHKIYDNNNNYKAQVAYLENRITLATETDFVKLIYAYIKLKKLNKSFEAAQLFAKTHPNSDTPYLSLYKFYISKHKTDEAINAMIRILKSSTVNENDKHKILNDFFEYTTQNLSLLPELEKAVALYPNPTVLSKLALFYTKHNLEKTTNYTDAAIKNSSNSFEDLKLIGTLLLEEQKFTEALDNSNKALELYPAQPVFYLQQAKAYNHNNLPKKALESLEFGLDYLIDNLTMELEFYQQMAKAYRLLNDEPNEQKYLLKAKKLNN